MRFPGSIYMTYIIDMVRPYCAMPIGIETTDHHLSRTIIRTCREKIRVACSLAAFSGGTQISHWQNGIDNRQQSLFFSFSSSCSHWVQSCTLRKRPSGVNDGCSVQNHRPGAKQQNEKKRNKKDLEIMDPSNNKKMAVIILRIKKKNYLSLSITLISFLWNLAHMWHCYFVVGFKLGLHMSSTVLSIFFLPAYQFRGGGQFRGNATTFFTLFSRRIIGRAANRLARRTQFSLKPGWMRERKVVRLGRVYRSSHYPFCCFRRLPREIYKV